MREFLVGEAFGAEKQEFGLARLQGRQGAGDFGLRLHLPLRRMPRQEGLETLEATTAAQLVESQMDGGAAEPGWRILERALLIPTEEDFDGKFFGAAGIASNAGDEAGDGRVLGAEEVFQIFLSSCGEGCARFGDHN